MKKITLNRKPKKLPSKIIDHLSEMQRRLIVILLAFIAFAVWCGFYIDPIVQAMVALGSQFYFVYLAPAELVGCYFKVILIIATILSTPVITYQVWAFVQPALTRRERQVVFLSLVGGLAFFAIGVVFAYYISIPFMLRFFVAFGSKAPIAPNISFDKYFTFLLNTFICFGVIFELPMLAMLLAQFGILKHKFMVRMRKYAILIIFIVAAIITPPDILSQLMIGAPMVLLYEVSIALCWCIERRKRKQQDTI